MFPYIADDCRRIANPLNSPADISIANPPSDLSNRGACFQKDCECSFELRGGIIRLSEKQWEYDCFHDDTIKESLVQFACLNEHYSPAASLSFAKGDDVIKGLLHNPERLDMAVLFVFFCIYFCLACWTYGIGVPSGLFVPSLIIGAAYGRFIGQALSDAEMLNNSHNDVSDRLGMFLQCTVCPWLNYSCAIPCNLWRLISPGQFCRCLCSRWGLCHVGWDGSYHDITDCNPHRMHKRYPVCPSYYDCSPLCQVGGRPVQSWPV